VDRISNNRINNNTICDRDINNKGRFIFSRAISESNFIMGFMEYMLHFNIGADNIIWKVLKEFVHRKEAEDFRA
jgi:hypothetical protein